MGMRLDVPRGAEIGKKGGRKARDASLRQGWQGRKIDPSGELVQTRNKREIAAKKQPGRSLEIPGDAGYIRVPEIVKDFTNSAPGRSRRGFPA